MFTRLAPLWKILKEISERFNQHLGSIMGAALSFYVLLSLIPLLSVGVAAMGWFFTSEEALIRVQSSLQSYLPTSGDVIYGTLAEIKRGRGLMAFLGLLGALFSAGAIFQVMEDAFNRIWDVQTSRGWFVQKAVALGTTILTLVLLLGSVGITSALTWLENRHLPGLDMRLGQIPFLWRLPGWIIPIFLSIMLFTMLYKIIPNCLISWKEAFAGGLFAGIAWEAAKILFALYAVHFANYNKVYGSLGGMMMLVVWVYYSHYILIFGAEIAAYRYRAKKSEG